MCAWANPMFPLVDNSDSPSVVEQLQQGHGSDCYTFISNHSWLYDVSYACQLASCSTGISKYASCSMTLCSPCPLFSFLFSSLSLFFSVTPTLPLLNWDSAAPFYPGYFLVGPWDSLSDYVHPGIACLAFQASDWVGAFWGSSSGFLISHLCLVSIQA